MDQYTAKLNNIRISPKKLTLVAALVRGMGANRAIENLDFVNKKGAKSVKKVLVSALNNAKNNFGANVNDLIIKEIYVTEAPTYKRGKAVSRGRYFQILKRGSNLNVTLANKNKS